MSPAAIALFCFVLDACGGPARLPLEAGIGPRPQLPPPENALIPAVKVSKAVGWPGGLTPAAAPGLKVDAFATGLDHPRWIYTLPNGDVLVAETSAPGTDPGPPGSRAYSSRVPEEGGRRRSRAPTASPFFAMLMATASRSSARPCSVDCDRHSAWRLIGNELFVANTDSLIAVPFAAGTTVISGRSAPGRGSTVRPQSSLDQVVGRLARRPFPDVGVGSNSNVGENGMAIEQGRAAIWQIDPRAGASHIFAGGLAIRSALPSTRGAARCGRPSTNVTNSAATSSPITSPRSAKAPFTAGRTAIMDSMWTSG